MTALIMLDPLSVRTRGSVPQGIGTVLVKKSRNQDIESQLRELTERTRRTRRELEDLIRRPEFERIRALSHDRPLPPPKKRGN
jgi:hypothetical protein